MRRTIQDSIGCSFRGPIFSPPAPARHIHTRMYGTVPGPRHGSVRHDSLRESRVRIAGVAMKLPASAHTARPWRIHELLHDFALEDVWELPTPGTRGDFRRAVELAVALDPGKSGPRAARALWALRWKLGALLGWDAADAGVGSRVSSLRDRLPQDLRDTTVPEFEALPFASLYLTEDEWAAEIANRTMHGVMHLGWVPDEQGVYRAQMAVYVKRNGMLGAAYMTAIRPFRHLIVYPAMMREIDRMWR